MTNFTKLPACALFVKTLDIRIKKRFLKLVETTSDFLPRQPYQMRSCERSCDCLFHILFDPLTSRPCPYVEQCWLCLHTYIYIYGITLISLNQTNSIKQTQSSTLNKARSIKHSIKQALNQTSTIKQAQ
jgi:hypothetical protein